MKIDAEYLPPSQHDGVHIVDRLERYPDSFTTEELEFLLKVYSHSPAKGRNAQIPAKAFLILEGRKKMTIRTTVSKGDLAE